MNLVFFTVQGILDDPALGKFIDSSLFSLKLSKNYTVDSTFQAITFHFTESLDDLDNEWHFNVLNRVAHVYPNGNNNPLNIAVAPQYWEFFQRFELDSGSTSVKRPTSKIPCDFPTVLATPDFYFSCFNNDFYEKWRVTVHDMYGNELSKTGLSENNRLSIFQNGTYILSFYKSGRFIGAKRIIRI